MARLWLSARAAGRTQYGRCGGTGGEDLTVGGGKTGNATTRILKTAQTSLFLDKFHLTTAIQNVLENAVKYGCNHINIRTSLVNNQFNISIQDDGIGISKNKHSLLFDKFYRVEQGNLHNTKGLGLGLYYVNQIIKAHQGTIAVISDLGKGAVFNISIPS